MASGLFSALESNISSSSTLVDIDGEVQDSVEGDLGSNVGSDVESAEGVVGSEVDDVEGAVGSEVDDVESEIGSKLDDVESEVGSKVNDVASEVKDKVESEASVLEQQLPSCIPTGGITSALGNIGNMLEGDETTVDGTVIPQHNMIRTASIIFGDFAATFLAFAIVTNIYVFGKEYLHYDEDEMMKANLIVIAVDAGLFLLTGCITDCFLGYSQALHVYRFACLVGACIMPLITFNWTIIGPSVGISIPIRRIYFYVARFIIGFGVCGIQSVSPPFAVRQIEKYGSSVVQTCFHYIYLAVQCAPLITLTVFSFVELSVSFFAAYLCAAFVALLIIIAFKFIRSEFLEGAASGGKAVSFVTLATQAVKNKLLSLYSACTSCFEFCACCPNTSPLPASIDEESMELLSNCTPIATSSSSAETKTTSTSISTKATSSGMASKDTSPVASLATKTAIYGSTALTTIATMENDASSTAVGSSIVEATTKTAGTIGGNVQTDTTTIEQDIPDAVGDNEGKLSKVSAIKANALDSNNNDGLTVAICTKDKIVKTEADVSSGNVLKDNISSGTTATKAATSEDTVLTMVEDCLEDLPETARHGLWVVYAMILLSCVVPYSIVRYQISTSYISQAMRMKSTILGYAVSSSLLHQYLPLVGIALTPIVNTYIYPYISSTFTTMTLSWRIVIGLGLATLSVFSAAIVETARLEMIDRGDFFINEINNHTLVSSTLTLDLLIPQYVFIGAADVFVYITCLEFAFRQSPCSMQAISTGIFLCYEGIGRIIAIILVPLINNLTSADPWYPPEINDGHLNYYFLVLTAISLVNLIVYCIMEKGYEEVDQYLCPVEETYHCGGKADSSATSRASTPKQSSGAGT